jgi:SAM-dependent methyltransferase
MAIDPLASLDELLEQTAAEIHQEVSPNDPMYHYNPGLYERAGSEALRSVRLAMLAGRVQRVASVLDFASGYGRVLRALKAAFPEATLTAADLSPPGVEFCSRAFGARAVVSDPDPATIDLGGSFDLIWSGSLMTHIDGDRWPGFLELFDSALTPGGVAVFTVYGRTAAEGLRTGKNLLNLTPEQARSVVEQYDETGFGSSETFVDVDAVISRPRLCQELGRTPSLELVLYTERGWLGQDVVACKKRPGLTASG